jgi:hypothetical protein
MPKDPIAVTQDPDNPRTVVLNRWPGVREKRAKGFKAAVREIRRPTPLSDQK